MDYPFEHFSPTHISKKTPDSSKFLNGSALEKIVIYKRFKSEFAKKIKLAIKQNNLRIIISKKIQDTQQSVALHRYKHHANDENIRWLVYEIKTTKNTGFGDAFFPSFCILSDKDGDILGYYSPSKFVKQAKKDPNNLHDSIEGNYYQSIKELVLFNVLHDREANRPRGRRQVLPSDDVCLILPYFNGPDLGSILSGEQYSVAGEPTPQLNDATKKAIALALFDLLGQLNKHNIVHADIKPDNIIVEVDGDNRISIDDAGKAILYLIDLGSAGIYGLMGPNEGTKDYIAPSHTSLARQGYSYYFYTRDYYAIAKTIEQLFCITGKSCIKSLQDIKEATSAICQTKLEQLTTFSNKEVRKALLEYDQSMHAALWRLYKAIYKFNIPHDQLKFVEIPSIPPLPQPEMNDEPELLPKEINKIRQQTYASKSLLNNLKPKAITFSLTTDKTNGISYNDFYKQLTKNCPKANEAPPVEAGYVSGLFAQHGTASDSHLPAYGHRTNLYKTGEKYASPKLKSSLISPMLYPKVS